MRIALGVEYDGSKFHGWQRQPVLRAVQTVVEEALSKVADVPIEIVCAGRTDAGVHAFDQVIHFDTDVIRSDTAWVLGTNANLPKDVAIKWAKQVSDDFHARFSATSRTYQYIITNISSRPALMRDYHTWYHKHLDEKKMRKGAKYLIGKHDFSSFRGADCQANTPVRTITKLDITRKDNLIIIDITANAFLHHMVRNIAGLLMAVGIGKKPPKWAKEVLAAKDRKIGEVTAPPNGLYLVNVKYR